MAIASLYDACCFLDFASMGDSDTPTDSDPNAVAHATAMCLHFGHPTPVERKMELEDHFADNPDINVRTSEMLTGNSDLDNLDLNLEDDDNRLSSRSQTLNADDLLNSVEDLLADPSLQQRQQPSSEKKESKPTPQAAPPPQEDSEEDWPELEPLPSQPPPLSDTEGYKDYMRLKYEHQQRENAILLRQMKKERAMNK